MQRRGFNKDDVTYVSLSEKVRPECDGLVITHLKRKDALWAIYLARVPSVGGVPTNLFNIPNRRADVRKRP